MASFVSCMFVAYSKPAVLLLSGQAVLCCMVRQCFVVWSGTDLYGQAVLCCMVRQCCVVWSGSVVLYGQAVCCMVRQCCVVWSGSVELYGQCLYVQPQFACHKKYPVSLVKPLGSYDRAS